MFVMRRLGGSEAVFSFVGVDDARILSAVFVENLVPPLLMRGWVLKVERGPRHLLSKSRSLECRYST